MESHVTVKRQPLPDSSDDAGQLLVERLRTLKQRTGLSLAALATATPFSKSTWHRYLNGDQFPPRQAVEALGRLADTDPGPLLSLWDAAVRAQARAATAPRQQPPSTVAPVLPAPAPAPVRARRLRRVRQPNRAVVALAAVAATVAVTAGAADIIDPDEAVAPGRPRPAAAAAARGVPDLRDLRP